jgi:hypothetical protein
MRVESISVLYDFLCKAWNIVGLWSEWRRQGDEGVGREKGGREREKKKKEEEKYPERVMSETGRQHLCLSTMSEFTE